MATIKIVLKAPGAKACGKYKRGIEYDVETKEAERLIKVKGFERVKTPESSQKTENRS